MGRLAVSLRSFWIPDISLKDPAATRYFGGGPTAAGVPVSEWTALNYSALWAGVQVIAGSVASLPLFHYKRLPQGGKERFATHRLYRLLHDEFNPEMTSMVARETMMAHVLTWGNAYAEIERNRLGEPIALWPITPDRVTPDRRDGGRIFYRVRPANGTGPDQIVPADDMIHVPGLGFDGLCGYSVVRKARETIALGLGTEKFGATFFGNGAWFGGFLQHPGRLTDAAKKHIETSVNAEHQGPAQSHKLMVIEEGMKYEKIGIPPDDAQFLQTRSFQAVEIARWLNLPVHKLREMENSSVRANIEQEAIEFVTDTLRPWLVRWEQELNRKLIRPLERQIQFCEHLVDGLLRGDLSSRYASYAVGRQWGWLSPDDVRELENMNPLPRGQGSVYLVPVNMLPADRLDEVIDKQVEPDPPPAAPAPNEPAPERTKPDPAVVARVISAQRALFVECLGRIARIEANESRRAAKKGREKFVQWTSGFYGKHESLFIAAVLPAMQAHLSRVNGGRDAMVETKALAKQYIDQSQAELCALPASDDFPEMVDHLVSRWEIERPAQIADDILVEELSHALA